MDMRVLLFVIILMFSFDAMAEPPDDLKAHLWSDRVLILAADAEHEELALMISRLEVNKDGLKERDLIVYAVDPQHELAKTWDVSKPFTLILVGKDGTEKLRSHKAVEVETLFETIDAMPMRIREMKSDPWPSNSSGRRLLGNPTP